MNDLQLAGARVLVVEDEFLLADELCSDLQQAGAEVVGPFGHLDQALQWAASDDPVAAAILDINVAGVDVYPLADILAERGVQVVFATGYIKSSLPQRFADYAVVSKPVMLAELLAAIQRHGSG